MPQYEIIRHATYHEIIVSADVTLGMFREILGELVKAENFPAMHALWFLAQDVRPPAFHEFDDMVAILQKVYATRPRNKRVALAVPGPFVRSVAEMFQAQASALPVQMRVFETPDAARAWLEG
ncbi:MAG: hypothetical protein ABR506_08545 [Candidatus Krumholzibacteriia bacterium]